MKNKVCLCGRLAHRWKLGGYVCLRCDMIEKKNKKMFVDMFDCSENGQRSRYLKEADRPLDYDGGFVSLSIR